MTRERRNATVPARFDPLLLPFVELRVLYLRIGAGGGACAITAVLRTTAGGGADVE